MQHISKFLEKYQGVRGVIFQFSDEWQACDLVVLGRSVRGFGTTNTNALLDAFRLLSLGYLNK